MSEAVCEDCGDNPHAVGDHIEYKVVTTEGQFTEYGNFKGPRRKTLCSICYAKWRDVG